MTQAGSSDVVLSIEGMTKVYPGTIALKNVDFEVHAASVNVLVGENGAGKSTLMKIIAGVEQPTYGRMTIDGREVFLNGPQSATAQGIGIVFQELNLFPNLSIAENIFMAREMVTARIAIDHAAQETEANALLKRLEHPLDPRTRVEDLRIGQQQIVEIAKALAQHARILILDEPTSALSAAEVKILFRVINELKSQGVAIVYISHRLDELIRIGDFITVLRDGRITGKARVKEIDVPWIVRQMTGAAERQIPKSEHVLGRVEAFRAEHISLPRAGGGKAVDDVSLSVLAGEIVGIYGLLGAGRSEFFECVIGRHPHAKGEIFIEGRRIAERDVTGRIGRGLFLIPEDRQREGLISILSVATNLTLASLPRFGSFFHIKRDKERAAAKEAIMTFGIKVSDPDREVSALSGGNQQKVVIGKALMTKPKVLLMDEPSRGIDIAAKTDVFSTMRRLADEGLAILFVTSDLDEVLTLSDRIAVMCNGRLAGIFDRHDASRDRIVAASAAFITTSGGEPENRILQ